MSNRIDRRFAELTAAGRTALIPFVTAGDPDPEWTVPVMHALVAGGADLVELGARHVTHECDSFLVKAN